MPRPKGWVPYELKGEEVPSVTGVLKYAKDAGALMYWAWAQGKDGKNYRDARAREASIGSLAHDAVRAYVEGRSPVWSGPKKLVVPAKRSFGAFREWADQVRLKITHAETRLVSTRLRVGGTLDAMLTRRKRAIGDWKTSNGVYWEYLVQLAAYGALWDENFPDDPIVGGYHLVRFDKKTGAFAHHWWPDLSAGLEAFKLMRRLYDLERELKPMTR